MVRYNISHYIGLRPIQLSDASIKPWVIALNVAVVLLIFSVLVELGGLISLIIGLTGQGPTETVIKDGVMHTYPTKSIYIVGYVLMGVGFGIALIALVLGFISERKIRASEKTRKDELDGGEAGTQEVKEKEKMLASGTDGINEEQMKENELYGTRGDDDENPRGLGGTGNGQTEVKKVEPKRFLESEA